jgi:hypothetical protein
MEVVIRVEVVQSKENLLGDPLPSLGCLVLRHHGLQLEAEVHDGCDLVGKGTARVFLVLAVEDLETVDQVGMLEHLKA